MPMTALLRNLATMTRVGVIQPGSAGTARVLEQLGDGERLRRARVHPITVLAALRTYAAGRGVRGQHAWTPVVQVIDALDAAFYAAFGDVEPAGKRHLLALDVSASMTWGAVAGVPGLTPRDASAAMALVTAATEPAYEAVGFTHGLTPLAISPRQRLEDAVRTLSDLPFGGTDCAQPMLYAMKHRREGRRVRGLHGLRDLGRPRAPGAGAARVPRAHGHRHPAGGDRDGSNGFSIADPADPGMLDVVGFDAATPAVVARFARGAP